MDWKEDFHHCLSQTSRYFSFKFLFTVYDFKKSVFKFATHPQPSTFDSPLLIPSTSNHPSNSPAFFFLLTHWVLVLMEYALVQRHYRSMSSLSGAFVYEKLGGMIKKSLPHKYKNLSSIPSTNIKRQVWWHVSVMPALGRQTQEALGMWTNQSRHISRAQV